MYSYGINSMNDNAWEKKALEKVDNISRNIEIEAIDIKHTPKTCCRIEDVDVNHVIYYIEILTMIT